jgi:ubiquinone/menaquinone biosynthesis C-methylase UbiE
MAVYEKIGKGYDLTRRADPYITSRLTYHLQADLRHSYLDVACGTGNYTAALAARGGRWYGIDQSEVMISAAKAKSGIVRWVIGDAARLPYGSGVFAGAVCTLATHHFAALSPPLREAHRVLAAGRLVILTATPEQISRFWLAEYFPEMIRRSAEQCPSYEALSRCLREAGFRPVETERYFVREDLQDFFLYGGKHRPEIYLDPKVRAGISNFGLLASAGEVEEGCRRLAADIRAGGIAKVIKKYDSGEGDYLFVIACKR